MLVPSIRKAPGSDYHNGKCHNVKTEWKLACTEWYPFDHRVSSVTTTSTVDGIEYQTDKLKF